MVSVPWEAEGWEAREGGLWVVDATFARLEGLPEGRDVAGAWLGSTSWEEEVAALARLEPLVGEVTRVVALAFTLAGDLAD